MHTIRGFHYPPNGKLTPHILIEIVCRIKSRHSILNQIAIIANLDIRALTDGDTPNVMTVLVLEILNSMTHFSILYFCVCFILLI